MSDEPVPGVAAGFDDGVVVFEDAVGELVLSQVLPDVLGGVEFWAVWRQRQQADVCRDFQFVAWLVPTCAIQGDNSMGSCSDTSADLGQVQVHAFGVGVGQHECRTHPTCWADGTEYVGPAIA